MSPAIDGGIGNDGSRAIWEAAHRLGLYGVADAALEELIQRANSQQPEARLAAEAARLVRRLRSGMARGDAC